MDFLDPQKQRRHIIRLYVGYVLIGLAILIGTLVLLYEASGFGFGKNGQVVQSGLVFVSSQPNPANIYLNGVLNKAQTNARLTVPAGQYALRLTRNGYRDWQRTITVQGGDVQHFDYPFLFPKKLITKSLANYPGPPGMAAESLDQRWLVVQQPTDQSSFYVYDLKNPQQAPTTVTLPASVVPKASGTQSWQAVQWADDNDHLLIQRSYDNKTEFILLDRQNPDQSLDLNQTLHSDPAQLTLNNNKYDQYYLLLASPGELDSASLGNPAPTVYLNDIISYKSYGSQTVLYATADNAPSGKVDLNIYDGSKSYKLREAAAGTTYLMDMAGYSGTPFVVIGAASENAVYVYKDPLGQLGDGAKEALPSRVLKITNPSYVAFSPTAQFVVVEGGTQFGVYDVFLSHAYRYTLPQPLDAPQAHATWMDGNRLTYVSGGKLLVFDYDKANQQVLMSASPAYTPFFRTDYHYVFALAPGANGTTDLTETALLIPSDQ